MSSIDQIWSTCTTCLDKRLIRRRGEVRAGAGGGQAGGCFDDHEGGDEGGGGCDDTDSDMLVMMVVVVGDDVDGDMLVAGWHNLWGYR